MVAIECGTCRCARWAAAREVIRRKGRHAACGEVLFGAGGFASGEAFRHQKSVSRYAPRRVMVETAPASSFVMAEPQFLLKRLVVAFNALNAYEPG